MKSGTLVLCFLGVLALAAAAEWCDAEGVSCKKGNEAKTKYHGWKYGSPWKKNTGWKGWHHKGWPSVSLKDKTGWNGAVKVKTVDFDPKTKVKQPTGQETLAEWGVKDPAQQQEKAKGWNYYGGVAATGGNWSQAAKKMKTGKAATVEKDWWPGSKFDKAGWVAEWPKSTAGAVKIKSEHDHPGYDDVQEIHKDLGDGKKAIIVKKTKENDYGKTVKIIKTIKKNGQVVGTGVSVSSVSSSNYDKKVKAAEGGAGGADTGAK